jgi:hypothetical protein
MTRRLSKNIAASIHQRLLNISRQTGRPFNELVMYYGIERFLYRLAQTRHADRVILKGGLMLQVWNVPVTRITRDIDLLGRLKNDLDRIREMIQTVCVVPVEEDGLAFDPGEAWLHDEYPRMPIIKAFGPPLGGGSARCLWRCRSISVSAT